MSEVRLPQSGGCACGAVRFDLTRPPLLAYACHCHDCQKRSGAAFALTLVIRTGDLQIVGETTTLRLPTPSGRELEHTLCPACATRLFVRALTALDYASLRAGALDDAAWVRPIAQVWTKSAIPWALIPDVAEVEPEEFDLIALAGLWQATAPRFIED
jgi:hypothetical protein